MNSRMATWWPGLLQWRRVTASYQRQGNSWVAVGYSACSFLLQRSAQRRLHNDDKNASTRLSQQKQQRQESTITSFLYSITYKEAYSFRTLHNGTKQRADAMLHQYFLTVTHTDLRTEFLLQGIFVRLGDGLSKKCKRQQYVMTSSLLTWMSVLIINSSFKSNPVGQKIRLASSVCQYDCVCA